MLLSLIVTRRWQTAITADGLMELWKLTANTANTGDLSAKLKQLTKLGANEANTRAKTNS